MMTRQHITASIVFAIALSGCATQKAGLPVPENVSALSHQFILSNDDAKTRLGAYPTYVLLEQRSGPTWNIIAISKQKIAITRSNQELLLVSRNYTNIVPAWNDVTSQYREDPVTGERKSFNFTGGTTTKVTGYGPENSRFAFLSSRYNVPTLSGVYGAQSYFGLDISELNQATVATNLLQEAQYFNEGKSNYPSKAPEIKPLQMSRQVWRIESNGAGEKGRYYFVPSRILSKWDEYIEDGSILRLGYTLPGYESEKTPFEVLSRIKVYGKYEGVHQICYQFLADFQSTVNYKGNTCPGFVNGQFPLRADSQTLMRNTPIKDVEGIAYGLSGRMKGESMKLRLDLSQISQIWILNDSEAQTVRATFK
jgi:hypothetical protein